MTYGDDTPRWIKSMDAFSAWCNVTFGRDHKSTSANESISGRAHRQRQRKEKWIDLFFWRECSPPHCEAAYLEDVKRAEKYLSAHKHRQQSNLVG
jgi:hypothetical protein